MADVNLAEFKALYLSTAKEYVEKMNHAVSLFALSARDQAAVDELHLSAHSLKSQSFVMGYSSTAELSHSLEKYARELKEKGTGLSDAHKSLLEKSVSGLEHSLSLIETEGKEVELTSEIEAVERVLGTL